MVPAGGHDEDVAVAHEDELAGAGLGAHPTLAVGLDDQRMLARWDGRVADRDVRMGRRRKQQQREQAEAREMKAHAGLPPPEGRSDQSRRDAPGEQSRRRRWMPREDSNLD